MIPENKVSDCKNVLFRQGCVGRRYGYAALGPDHLNGAINGIAYYEQVRLGNRFTLVFTSRDAYLYDTQTGTFTPISLTYNTGTARCDVTAVTGVGSTWLHATWILSDIYQIKFGTDVASTDTVAFTGDCGSAWTEQVGSGSRGWYGVASSSDGTKLVASVYGGQLYTSTDSGVSWTARDSNRAWRSVASSSDGTKLVASVQGGGYIYLSNDSGLTWEAQTTAGSRDWIGVALSSDGMKIAAGGTSTNIWTCLNSPYVITSVSALTNLYVGLELSATFLQAGTRIVGLNYVTNVITIDRAYITSATTGAITADISDWYTVYSVDSNTGITLTAVATIAGDTANGSAVISNIADTSMLHAGMGIDGVGIPAASYILSIDSSTQITISANATADGTAVALYLGPCIVATHEVDYILKLSFNGEDDDYWSFAYPYLASVGDKILCASNGVEPIYKWDGSGSLEVLGGSPPSTAKYIGYFGASMYEHFIAAWTTAGGNNLPQSLYLSDAGSPELWTAGAYYDLLQKNDEIVGMEILKSRLVIYKSRSISLAWASPEGGNDDPLDMEQDVVIDIEIPVGRTVVNFGDFHMFLGMDNVYKFNGLSLEPVGTEIINTMKNEWNGAAMIHAFAFAIPNENLYCIFIPTLEERDENDNIIKEASEYPDKAYVYNYVERTWTIWTFYVDPVTHVSQQFTCAGRANKSYTPTIADIDTLDQMYSDMDMRWSDLIKYSEVQSIFLGDNNGYVYELRDVYQDDNGQYISASFTTRDYELNTPKHVFMLLEAVLGMTRQASGTVQVRASTNFGATWSDWVDVAQGGDATFIEYIANFIQKGLQVRFEVQNINGADFEIESINVGFNDEMGKKKG